MQPHELTQAEFLSAAHVTRLVDHDRKWTVTFGAFAAFSDAVSAEEAKRIAHHGAIVIALYFNTTLVPEGVLIPSMPSSVVLDDYPDLVELFDVSAVHTTRGHICSSASAEVM